MLKKYFCALLLASVTYVVPAAIAQDSGAQASGSDDQQQSAPAENRAEHGGRHFDPAARADHMSKMLDLTPDQKAKVQDILNSEQTKMESLRQDSSMSREDRRAKMMDIHKQSADQIRTLLNETQQQKFDDMRSKMQERMQSHRQGEAGSGDSQPSSPPDNQQ